ncbi:MAG: AraC family transcriptional regulator [Clostridia bacterium]|nr:AraC family transcriptional regulator [Clostridia bacterium]
MDVKFHCPLDIMFPLPDTRVKAFPYFNYSIEPHDHEFYEINVITSGKGIHRINGNEIQVQRGNVFFIPTGSVHEYFDTKNLTVYHIVLSPEIIENNLEEARLMQGYCLFTDVSKQNYLFLPEHKMQSVEADLELINRFGTYGLAENSPMIPCTVWKLIYFFSYELSKAVETKDAGRNKYNEQIRLILEYIHGHFGQKLSVELLSKKAYMSRSTFLRAFERVCGTTPMKYLDNYRILRARLLLESTSMSKSEVAQACGFYDLSHMEKKLGK